MIGGKEEIKLKEIKMIEQYMGESLELKKIAKLHKIEEIGMLQKLIGEKMELVAAYLKKKYEDIYNKIMNFDNISKTKGQCQS